MKGAMAVGRRVLTSIRGDHRTLALVVGAPIFITFLFAQVLDQVPEGRFNADFVKPVILGFFVFFLTYLLTAIGFLRERQAGTLERTLVSPATRSGLVIGYLGSYGLIALVQSGIMFACGVFFFKIRFPNGVWLFVAFELLGALTALGLGVLVSLFARNEFQVLQFIPVVLAPQIILGGVFIPVDRLPWYLEYPARAMPLTYMLKGMNYVVLDQGTLNDVWLSLAVLVGYALGSVALATFIVRR